jgi:hypothetical protein
MSKRNSGFIRGSSGFILAAAPSAAIAVRCSNGSQSRAALNHERKLRPRAYPGAQTVSGKMTEKKLATVGNTFSLS